MGPDVSWPPPPAGATEAGSASFVNELAPIPEARLLDDLVPHESL